ncbi:hypothetical protein EPH_0016680 [Eimeria praecox]|uniref:Uncharacterized protein n=1 Tax=Eimeria praecox TaxID=51316 RepID=U6G6B3_9EIME|nr:hypothetical protein EPH_0016680 [Eimeria praecox]
MIQEYRDQIEEEEPGSETRTGVDGGGQAESFFMQNAFAAPVEKVETPPAVGSIHRDGDAELLEVTSGAEVQADDPRNEVEEESNSMEPCQTAQEGGGEATEETGMGDSATPEETGRESSQQLDGLGSEKRRWIGPGEVERQGELL